MTTPDIRWVLLVRGEDRPGTLTAVTGVFSSRGVSFESLAIGDVVYATGLMPIVFTASERLARVLVRSLERLAVVRDVRLERADNPQLRAVAAFELPAGAPFEAPPGVHVQLSGEPGQPRLVVGTLADVERVLALARASGAAGVASAILPPSQLIAGQPG